MEAAVTVFRKRRTGMLVQSLRVREGSSEEAIKAAPEPPHTAEPTTRSFVRVLHKDLAAIEEANVRTYASTNARTRQIGGRRIERERKQ